MHVLKVSAILSVYVYAIFYNWDLLKILLLFLGGYYVMGFLVERQNRTSMRKKTALSSWNSPGDPSVFNNLELEADKLDSFIERHRQKFPEERVTYTHLVLKSLAYTIKSIKGLNSTISFGGFRQIKDVDISCLVDVEGTNLATLVVRDCNLLSVGQIQQQIKSRVKKLKTKKDEDFNHQMGVVNSLHSSLVSCVLELSSFISYYLGRDIKPLKIRKFGFGTAIVTNCSNMEIYNSYAPLVPFTKCMCVVLICKPKMRPVVDEHGQVVARKMVNINVTFDHRYADGTDASRMIKNMYHFFDNMDTLAYEVHE